MNCGVRFGNCGRTQTEVERAWAAGRGCLLRECLVRQSISLSDRIWLSMARLHHPGVIHSCTRVSRRGCVDGVPLPTARYVDKPVETVDSHRQLLALPDAAMPRSDRRRARSTPLLPPHAGVPPQRRPAARHLSPGLGWSGDPGVLPVRHSVERARAATRVVSPLSRGADGAVGGRADGRPTVEYARCPAAGQTARGRRVAAHAAAAAAGLPLDSGAPRRRTARATRTTPLGPTPRYAVIPRWGLSDRVEQAPRSSRKAPRGQGHRQRSFVRPCS